MGSGNTKTRPPEGHVPQKAVERKNKGKNVEPLSPKTNTNSTHHDTTQNKEEPPNAIDNDLQQTKTTETALSNDKETNLTTDEEYLRKYCEKTTHLTDVFTNVFEAVTVLKTKCDKEGTFLVDLEITKEVKRAASDIAGVYSKYRSPINKRKLGGLLIDLAFPRVVVDISRMLKDVSPRYLTWDREKAEEAKEQENINKTEQAEPSTQTSQKNNKNAEGKVTETDEKDTDSSSETAEDPEIVKIKKAQDLMLTFTMATINFTDIIDEFCITCGEAGMVEELTHVVDKAKDCTSHMVKYVNPETQTLKKYTTRGKILSRTLGTLHNVSKRIPSRQHYHSCGTVHVLLPLLKDDVALYAAKALLILAYLIDEQNNGLIMANEEPIKFLIFVTSKACRMVSRRYLGLSNSELAEGLAQIAVNDANKKLIGQNGAIPILVNMIAKAKGDSERSSAAEALWVLAFDKENREAILNNPGAVDELKKARQSDNDTVKKAAAGALWEIEGKQSHASTTQDAPASSDIVKSHIMISYQWDVQPLMIQVKNQLQAAGYRVWMDLEQMGGSTLEAMAAAVENAAVVLMCVSQKYKESPNCRSEAEYAFQLHKGIVPLMMESRYRPDGWLGMIMGSKLWIDFSAKQQIDSSVAKLVREIGARGKDGGETGIKVGKQDVVDAMPKIDISTWTKDDVTKWMEQIGLTPSNDCVISQYFNGRFLQRLADLRSESPEFFYSCVKQDLGLAHVYQVLLFTDELDKLVR